MQKEYITEELVKSFSVLCDGFANTSILSRISNVFLVIGFSTPHSLNYSHFLRRACFLASYFLKFMEITRRCDETLAHFFWVGGLMLINFLHQLKHLERHRPGIFGIFVAVVGRDVAKKMYNLNEHLTLADQVAYKALHLTENWFISCRHKDTQFIKSEKVPSLSSLAYLKEKSSNHCRHQVVIPSLSLQKRLTFWNECPYSKRLSKKESRDPHWKRDILWSSALAHCGFCSWCRPLTVGEKEHASGKRAGETTLEQELQLY
ncbi:unnamed protein product [Lepeophtheirus salmonis]|uniref:(salmon louse) hypothetical protein n=1 Tax=Lepeophtheirus salmonis TaxID=72036 RepID=A0A7R8HCE6_LEPSM|nr:unnamed protein product [Lepeophtheirus salmonis]CAF3013811.1 unnamed protein product [Lepeophtheirus salmonis]